MEKLWIGLIGALAGPVFGWITALILPNGAVKAVGATVGKLCSGFFRQKIGANWEQVEGHIQGTLSAFITGLHEGLDYDDQ